MKLSKLQTALTIAALFLVMGAIIFTGFTFRPVWPGSRGETPKGSESELTKIFSKLTPAQREASGKCQYNQVRIEQMAISYEAEHHKYPPLGTIDENHPLVKEGYFESPPTCPSTGRYYVLIRSRGDAPPHTECPTHIPAHKIP